MHTTCSTSLEVDLRRFASAFALLCLIAILLTASPVYAGPSLEDLPRAEINEMLESSRAKSKSDIKVLMELGFVVPGGSAKSGLRLATLHELKHVPFNYGGFSPDSRMFLTGNRKHLAWWDVATLELQRILLVESKKNYIFGVSSGGQRLVIAKAQLDGNKSEFDFEVYDGQTLKEVCELRYNKSSQKDLFGNFNKAMDMGFALSPDGKWFLLCHGKGPIQVWDAQSGALVHENYNYNNKSIGTAVEFSQNGQFAAVRHGGKQVLYSLQPFRKIRDLGGATVTPSPNGTYLATGGLKLEKMTGGTLCSTDSYKIGAGFTYDESYWLTVFQNAVVFKPTDVKDCPDVNTVFLPDDMKAKKFISFVIPAPDGKHYAFHGLFDNPDVTKIRIYNWTMPDKHSTLVLAKAERGMELYAGGLKPQGEAMLRDLVKSDAKTLWLKDYDVRFVEAGVPLDIVGTMILNAAGGAVDPYMYSVYAIYASQAKQPFLAAKAIAEVNKVGAGTSQTLPTVSRHVLANALSLKVAGRNDDAYSTLIKYSGDQSMTKAMIDVFKRYPDAFAPLLKESGKVALALDIDQSLLPKPGREGAPQNYPDLQGNIVKVMPPATPTTNEKQTDQAVQSGPGMIPVKSKKSSVILE